MLCDQYGGRIVGLYVLPTGCVLSAQCKLIQQTGQLSDPLDDFLLGGCLFLLIEPQSAKYIQRLATQCQEANVVGRFAELCSQLD